jgi:UDP-GlcNAc:undecaprenyl-phosphate GlcNAc-1-phosphate transferase
MTSEATGCIISGVVALIATYIATFPSIKLAHKIGAVVPPDERRVHKVPLPDLGGAALFIGLLFGLLAGAFFSGLSQIYSIIPQILGIVIGGGAIFFIGLVDDRIDMSPPAKLAGQVLSAMILYFAGDTMYWFKIPFAAFIVLSPTITPLITAIWVIMIENAINLIDGLDGLAAGIVAIASGSFAIYAIKLIDVGLIGSSNPGPLLAAICCGMTLGFLPNNFHPSKIMMGDSGALLLGFLMAAATSVVGGRTPDTSGETYFFFAPLFIPLIILGVPILDVAFAIIRRTYTREGFAYADKGHLHHRLLRLGHGQRRAVAILWLWTVVLSGLVLYPVFDPNGNIVVPFGIAVLLVSLYTWFRPGLGKEGAKPDKNEINIKRLRSENKASVATQKDKLLEDYLE